jgi:hypothetical protein
MSEAAPGMPQIFLEGLATIILDKELASCGQSTAEYNPAAQRKLRKQVL